MSDSRRFTKEEIEYVARLQTASAPRFNPSLFDATVFAVLVSADITTWSVVALRGLKAMLGA